MSSTAAAQRAVRFVVAGRVQGVGFRVATLRHASGAGVRGWVRNLPSGAVEVVAAAAPEELAALASWLWRGPPAARVTGVTLEEWSEAVPDGFKILH